MRQAICCVRHTNPVKVSFPVLLVVGTVIWVYWICNVCGWYMWREDFPNWINTISSRWLQHLVPLFCDRLNALLIAVVLGTSVCMQYCLFFSHRHIMLMFLHRTLQRSHTVPAVSPQSIFHGSLEWLCHGLIGNVFCSLRLEEWPGTMGRVIGHDNAHRRFT